MLYNYRLMLYTSPPLIFVYYLAMWLVSIDTFYVLRNIIIGSLYISILYSIAHMYLNILSLFVEMSEVSILFPFLFFVSDVFIKFDEIDRSIELLKYIYL